MLKTGTDSVSPLCGCGCGGHTRWGQHTRQWNRFVNGHNRGPAEKEADEPSATTVQPDPHDPHCRALRLALGQAPLAKWEECEDSYRCCASACGKGRRGWTGPLSSPPLEVPSAAGTD